MSEKIKLGVSTCLLGESVRYDGGHKLNRYLRDTLGPFVEWVPVCPEVECGLSVPREAMRLIGDPEAPRLKTNKTGIDYTEQMLSWARNRLNQLEQDELCGFIFKAKSPSSGMRDIKVYSESGMPSKKGAGLFAKAFMDRFELMPVEDEGRLNDAGLRENFIERVFVYHRWHQLEKKPSLRGLVDFHTNHKFMLMAHSPAVLRELGALVAGGKKKAPARLYREYFSLLMPALKLKTTVRKNVNVLHHIMGFFKKQLTGDEKSELLEVIEQYQKQLVPLIVPVTLVKHFTRKYADSYLLRQVYLNPHPMELMLRNHV